MASTYCVPSSDRDSYQRKIEILSQGGETICDPYKVPQENWIDDITLWPEVELIRPNLYLLSGDTWPVYERTVEGLQESGSIQLLY